MKINSVPGVKCFCNNKNVLGAQSMVWHFELHPVYNRAHTWDSDHEQLRSRKMYVWRGLIYVVSGKGKGKGYPVTGHEGPALV